MLARELVRQNLFLLTGMLVTGGWIVMIGHVHWGMPTAATMTQVTCAALAPAQFVLGGLGLDIWRRKYASIDWEATGGQE